MTTLAYEYRAMDKAGARREGVARASNAVEAFRVVSAMGLTPLAIHPARPGSRWTGRRTRIKGKELAQFTYQLGVLVQAGIPIIDGLLSVAEQEREGQLREVVTDIARRIEGGEHVAGAMDAHRAALGDVYVETVRAAERSGNLSKVLEHLADLLERSQESARMVRSALMYPACVVGVLSLAITFLLGFVIPRFSAMFQERGVKLPAFTRGLMAFGDSMRSHWWIYLPALGLSAWLLRRAWRTEGGRAVIDRVLHRVPYLSRILVGAAIARFARVFGLSLASGLGLIESLELSGRSSGRPMLMRDTQRMVGQVRAGGRLADVLPSCSYLTAFCKRLMVAGEQSADLPKMCGIIARQYERETAHLTKNLGTVIEPVLIVAIGAVVLVVALAIFLPMWDLVTLVG